MSNSFNKHFKYVLIIKKIHPQVTLHKDDMLGHSVRLSFHTRPTVLAKNVTPRRMLKKYFLIAQMNRQINSFQNM